MKKQLFRLMTGLLLCVILSLPIYAYSNSMQAENTHKEAPVMPRFTSISSTDLYMGETSITVELTAQRKSAVRVAVTVADTTSNKSKKFSASATGTSMQKEFSYSFQTGHKYKITCTFTVDNESTTKSITKSF